MEYRAYEVIYKIYYKDVEKSKNVYEDSLDGICSFIRNEDWGEDDFNLIQTFRADSDDEAKAYFFEEIDYSDFERKEDEDGEYYLVTTSVLYRMENGKRIMIVDDME